MESSDLENPEERPVSVKQELDPEQDQSALPSKDSKDSKEPKD